MSSFLGAGVPIFEIREAGGPATDMLIRDPALRRGGRAQARRVGSRADARPWHVSSVGRSIEQVVFRAIYTEINAKLKPRHSGSAEGDVAFLNAEEAANATATNNLVLSRAWELWKQQGIPSALSIPRRRNVSSTAAKCSGAERSRPSSQFLDQGKRRAPAGREPPPR